MTVPLTDEILRRLLEAPGRPVSGQVLADRLGVSRAAVWKGVTALRSRGYPVDSLPGRGYRLAPGPRGVRPGEIAARLRTTRLGRVVRYHPTTDSTNRVAERWAEQGAPEGALVVADHQTGGRGRLGRSWGDEPGESLLLSLVLRPTLPAATTPTLTYVAAVALAETLAGWIPPARIGIKWPNDVLVEERKVAGILLEMRCEAHRVQHVVLGVGLNVTGDLGGLPEEVRARSTTVARWADPAPDRLDLLCRFLETLEARYDERVAHGFASVRDRWNGWFRAAGRRVRVRTGAQVIEGTASGLGPDGALLVHQDGVGAVPVLAGDLETATTRDP